MPETTRPNILWLCTDQQRYDTIAALGYPGAVTPVVDRMVGEGTAFTHAYCQSQICTPSRASFLTGLYPSTVHVTRNGNLKFPKNAKLISRIFADAGYDCGLAGKFHLSSAFERLEPRLDDGYRLYAWSHSPWHGWEEGHAYADWVQAKGADLKALNLAFEGTPPEFHQTTWATETLLDFIQEPRESPWFFSWNIFDPHPPFDPPQVYLDQFDPARMPDPLFRESDFETQRALLGVDFQSEVRDPKDLDTRFPVVNLPQELRWGSDVSSEGPRDAWSLKARYFAMIKQIDDNIGRIPQVLDESGQRKNTIVIFTTDHGEALGDHGLIQKGCRFYEGLTRVPLVFSWPGTIKPGVISPALVELMDIPATLLELAGLPIPEEMQSRSLAPLLTGSAGPEEHREAVRCEFYDALALPDSSFGTMYRNRRYKLVVYHGHGLGELYDLQTDPGEFDNLWDDPNASDIKAALLLKSYDASILATDRGGPRHGHF